MTSPLASSMTLPPAEAFAPLLTESLNGFAVLDSEGRYVYASASLCSLLLLNKDALLGRAFTELVYPADCGSIVALLGEARSAAAAARPCESFAQVCHACGGTVEWQPVELKACTDGEYTYCVLLDARVPARLESVLPQFLLSTSHDLRTPCSSLQAATALLLTWPSVAADGEACSLLRTMDASCSALLRCVANVLTMRQLQRASPLPLQLPPPRVFDPVACVRRVVDMVAALDCVQPCLECSFEPEAMPPLPSWVVGDEGSIAACLQNLLITSLLWLPRKGPVRLHISTAEVAQASHVGLRVTAQPPPASYDLLLVISVETPGRALTAQELDSILTPFAMLPADKGGGTGLALYVTNGLARAMGGSLEVQAGRQDGTLLRLRVPLRVPEGATPPDFTPAAAAGPAEFFPVPEPDPARLLPQRRASELSMHVADAAELQLTSRMFNCLLASSDDIFAQCTLSVLQGEDAVAATAEGQPLISARIDYVSPAVVCRLAFSQADAVGLNILDVCHPGDRGAFLDVLQQAHAGSGPYGHRLMYVHRNVTADSRTIWCQTVGVCVGDRLYLVCRDMRTIRSVELTLRAFTLATSHDMREPCNSILVALAVLERRPCVVTATAADEAAGVAAGQSPPMSVRELVACIRSACGLLLGIVGNVLTAPQVESGELTLEIDVFSPTRLIMEVLQACRLGYAAAAHHAPVELESYGETLPLMVEGDRCRVAQVVQNLITNAYKFGGNKPVRVQSGLQRGADGQTNLVVLVHDSGRGMSETEAASCFDAGQAAPAAAGGGTGLGLYISNAFARLMSGSLSVKSELGVGSTFELRVPVRVLPPNEAAEAAATLEATEVAEAAATEEAEEAQLGRAANFAAAAAAAAASVAARGGAHPMSEEASRRTRQLCKGFRVLVADDHPLNLRLFTRLLQMHGFVVTAVPDGSAALEALQASFAAQQQSFDVAVLDMDMPYLRGPQVAAAFREWEARERPSAMRLPIIALTANVMEEHAAECSAAGMDLFLSKPLRDEDVMVLRAHAIAYSAQRGLEASSEGASAGAIRVAAEAAAARASASHDVLGMPLVAAAQRASSRTSSRGSARSSDD